MSLGPAEELFSEVDVPDRCAECGRERPPPHERRGEWHMETDGTELHLFCPECWDREFGPGRID